MATATLSQHQVGPDNEDGSNSPANKSCLFYKLIVDSILQAKKLKIPDKFVRRYGDELSSVATLVVPNGRIWLVELKKADQRLWFQVGWQQFVEFYSINVGYFLVFRYEGNSTFNVHIYDLTASEIKYPGTAQCSLQERCHDKRRNFHHKKEDAYSAKLTSCPLPISYLDECEYSKRTKFWNFTNGVVTENTFLGKNMDDLQVAIRLTQDAGAQFNETEITRTANEANRQFLDDADHETERTKQITQFCEVKFLGAVKVKEEFPVETIISKTFTRRWRAATTEEKERAIHAAEMFESNYPFCRVILRPSYVYKALLLHIPTSFARAYLKGIKGVLTLQLPDGRRWPVRCVFKGGSAKLSKGWSEFVWENYLDEGDVCIFELINTANIVLKVTIFRVHEEEKPENQPPNWPVCQL